VAKRQARKTYSFLYSLMDSPELYVKGDAACEYDALLETLRLEYEDGDPLALNIAFLLCHSLHWFIPPWVPAGLAFRLKEEMRKSSPAALKSKKRIRRIEKQYARYETVMWFRRQGPGCSVEDALALTAKAFGKHESTIRKTYKAFLKKHKRLLGLPPSPSKPGWTPADLPEGPDKATLLRLKP
jgi:hypothetical protein